VTYFVKFWDPLHISGTGIWRADWPPAVVKVSRDLFSKFFEPLHIWRRVEARYFKFGKQISHRGTNEKCKIRSKEVVKGSRDVLLEL